MLAVVLVFMAMFMVNLGTGVGTVVIVSMFCVASILRLGKGLKILLELFIFFFPVIFLGFVFGLRTQH